jgi:hypothetical protein
MPLPDTWAAEDPNRLEKSAYPRPELAARYLAAEIAIRAGDSKIDR